MRHSRSQARENSPSLGGFARVLLPISTKEQTDSIPMPATHETLAQRYRAALRRYEKAHAVWFASFRWSDDHDRAKAELDSARAEFDSLVVKYYASLDMELSVAF